MDGRSPYPRGELHLGPGTVERGTCRSRSREYPGKPSLRRARGQSAGECGDEAPAAAGSGGADGATAVRKDRARRLSRGLLWHTTGSVQIERRCRQSALGALGQGISQALCRTLADRVAEEGRLRDLV